MFSVDEIATWWDEHATAENVHDLIYRGSADDPDMFVRSGMADANLVVDKLSVAQDDVVLDIGSGIGRVARHVADHCGQVVCVDVSKVMLEKGEEYCSGLPVHFRVCNGMNLSVIETGTINAAYSFLTFQHMQKPRVFCYLVEVERVLSSDGRFLFTVPTIFSTELVDGYRNWLNMEDGGPMYMRVYHHSEIAEYCARAGLRITSLESIGDYMRIVCVKQDITEGDSR